MRHPNVRYRCRCGRTFTDELGAVQISMPETIEGDDGRPIGLCPVLLPLPNAEWPNWRWDPSDPDFNAIDWHIFKPPPGLREATALYWRVRLRIRKLVTNVGR